MIKILFLINLYLLSNTGDVLGECSGGCKEPLLLYDELKCSPIYNSPTDCCPVRYDCSNVEQRAASKDKKCYLNGKAYSPGEQVNDEEVYPNCRVGCHCRSRGEGTSFTCAVLDCPEWLGHRPEPGCHAKYELDKCCSVGSACPPFTTTCEVGGKTYYEGQEFSSPDDKCTKCICLENFKGKYEAPFCKKRQCVEEISYSQKIHNFCAPSYINLDDCCPWNWICPEESDKIISGKNQGNSDVQCKFGEKVLHVGDKFERTSGSAGKLSCECRIPPYLTCIQNYDYPSFAPSD